MNTHRSPLSALVLCAGLYAPGGVSADSIAVYGEESAARESLNSEVVRRHTEGDDLDLGRWYVAKENPRVTLLKGGEVKDVRRKQTPDVETTVLNGTFRSNLLRIAGELGYGPLIFDPLVTNCVWQQKTQYKISGKDPREVLAYYAATQDFALAFSEVDSHVELKYVGPVDRLEPCLVTDSTAQRTTPASTAEFRPGKRRGPKG